MSKLLAVLVLGCACLFAQEFPLIGPVRDSNPHTSSPKDYRGCVIRSGGKILLTDPRGTEYNLVSSDRQLDSYVGHEVKITAFDVNPSAPSSGEKSVEGGNPQGQPPTLDVETIEKVADHCTSPQ